jgi:hypothetical protein
MPRLELNQLLAQQNITPEQQIFLTWIYSQFDNRSAANRRIINVEPVFFQGALAGNEFTVYAATKVYVCYELMVSNDGNLALNDPTGYTLYLYDENGILTTYITTYRAIEFDTTLVAARGQSIMTNLYNIYFSRIVCSQRSMKFIGYRITLI